MLHTHIGLLPISPSMSLHYDKWFLKPVPTPYEASSLPYDVVPPQPTAAPEAGSVPEEAGSRALWRGKSRPAHLSRIFTVYEADGRLGVR